MDTNKWISLFILRSKILLRANIFLGLYIRVIRPIITRKDKLNSLPKNISNIFSKDDFQKGLSKFIINNESQKNQLLTIANNFIDDKVSIYGNQIKLNNYSVYHYKKNIKLEEVFHKDLRFYWEVYRSKFLINVGIAYKYTNNEDYAKQIIKYIINWEKYSPIESNEIRYNGMEASIKLIYLSLLDFLLDDSINYTKEIKNELIISIIKHANYVYDNYDITYYGLESNHGLCCSVGLIYASLLFPNYEESSKWYSFGEKSLIRALNNQFSEDGVNFESSTNYHRYNFEILTFLLSALYIKDYPLKNKLEKSLQKIGKALKKLTHKNDYISRFGDSDGGKFLPDLNTIEDFNDMGYLKWFTGTKKQFLETIFFEKIPQFQNFLSNVSHKAIIGNYISFKNKDLSLIVSANEIGTLGKGNHQHNDFMSFELYSTTPFIVDPWSYCYTGNHDFRNNDRKTKSHNCVEIDNREIVPYGSHSLFEMLGNIKVNINGIKETSVSWDASLTHSGYKNLDNGSQIHTRNFQINKINNEILIVDNLNGTGSHYAKMHLLIPKKYWEFTNDGDTLIFSNENEIFKMATTWSSLIIDESEVSSFFLNKEEAYRIILEQEYQGSKIVDISINYISKK